MTYEVKNLTNGSGDSIPLSAAYESIFIDSNSDITFQVLRQLCNECNLREDEFDVITAVHSGKRENVEKIITISNQWKKFKDSAGFSVLHHAICYGESDIVSLLLLNGADVHAAIETDDLHNVTVLHLAAYLGLTEICCLLLEAGTDPNIHLNVESGGILDGATPLHLAVYSQSLHVVEIFLNTCNNVLVNAFTNSREPPLLWAVRYNLPDICESLIKHKASVHLLGLDNLTVMHISAFYNSVSCMKILASFGCHIDSLDYKNRTPLHIATQRKHYETASELVCLGAEINTKSKDLCTPLHNAARSSFLKNVQLLLKAGASVNETNENGDTALHLAVKSESPDIVETLLKNGANVNIQNNLGQIALHLVVYNFNPWFKKDEIIPLNKKAPHPKGAMYDIPELLIAHPLIDINLKDKKGITVLQKAVSLGSFSVVELLLKSGKCDVNTITKFREENGWKYYDRSVLHDSIFASQYLTAKLLIKHGADVHQICHVEEDLGRSYDLSCLHLAILKAPLVELIELLVKAGCDIDYRSSDGYTPLHVSITRKQEKCCEALIKLGADINAISDNGSTPLMIAARDKTLKGPTLLSILLANKCDVDIQEKQGFSALHFAAENVRSKPLELLLASKANPNLQTKKVRHRDRITPLVIAIEYGTTKMSEILLKNKADPNARYMETNLTPLHLASQLGKPEVVKLLIRHGGNLESTSTAGETPLIFSLLFKQPAISIMLIEAGCNIHARAKIGNGSERTALHIAAELGHEKVIRHLVDFGADLNSCMVLQNVPDITPLHMACLSGTDKLIEDLVNLGADVNSLRGDGFYPLITAASKAKSEAGKALILAGSSVTRLVKTGRHENASCLHFAAQQGDHELVMKLVDAGVNVHAGMKTAPREGVLAVSLAAENGFIDILQFLLRNGNYVNETEECGFTPLHYSTAGGHIEIVKYLLSLGAEVDKRASYENRTNMSALHMACEKGNINVACELIDAGADINAVANRFSTSENTPLFIAVANNYKDLTECLLHYGANPNVKNSAGVCPIHVAAQRGQHDIFDVLIKANCDTNAVIDGKNVTAVHLAAEKGYTDIMRALIAAGSSVNQRCTIEDKFSKMTSYDITALHQACGFGHGDIVVHLLEAGADPLACEVFEERKGIQPVHCAGIRGRTDVIDILVRYGISVNVADEDGFSPLHWSAQEGFDDTTEKFLQFGANPLLKNTKDELASDITKSDIIKSLLKKHEKEWLSKQKE